MASLMHLSVQTQYILNGARVEAQRSGARGVSSAHLLLALLIKCDAGNPYFKTVSEVGLDMAKIRKLIPEEGAPLSSEFTVPFTEGVKAVLHRAEQQANSSRHPRIDTGHILYGLLGEVEGPCAAIFAALSIDRERARQLVLGALGSVLEESPSPQ